MNFAQIFSLTRYICHLRISSFFLTWNLSGCMWMYARSSFYAIPGFEQLKNHIYTVFTALHVHDLLAKNLPLSFDTFFPIVNHTQHDRITRQYNNLPQTLARTQFSTRTPYHAIPALWNKLELSTQTTQSRTGFKTKLTQQIMTQYKSEVTCNNPRCPDCRT